MPERSQVSGSAASGYAARNDAFQRHGAVIDSTTSFAGAAFATTAQCTPLRRNVLHLARQRCNAVPEVDFDAVSGRLKDVSGSRVGCTLLGKHRHEAFVPREQAGPQFRLVR
jgi:hypothetical protein